MWLVHNSDNRSTFECGIFSSGNSYVHYVVYVGVWITTGGTMCDDDLARYIGESVHTCMQQSGSIDHTPVIIGFANLDNIIYNEEIRQQSHSISDVDQQVR